MEERIKRLERKREKPLEILTLGWIRVINEAGEFIDKKNKLTDDQMAKLLLIPLVAAYDIIYRSSSKTRRLLHSDVIAPINNWFDKTTGLDNSRETKEVEMWKLIDRYRFGSNQQKNDVVNEVENMPDGSQKAILLARIARENGNKQMMEQAIKMITLFSDEVNNRPETLLRWQKEMKGSSKQVAKMREMVVKTEYWIAGLFVNAWLRVDFNKLLTTS